VSVTTFTDLDEAVAIANDTVYGLQAAVYGADLGRARQIAARLRAGQVVLNEAGGALDAPFGGYKQSGLGREYGVFGFEEFLEVKAIAHE
jgi:aldehyde dehydrogenase (NAD+)